MAFDEDGQADNLERRKAICERAYRILVDEVGFPAEDIIFDPNVFAVATGIEEHATYGLDFIEATRWIKQNLPGAKVSGGISNVSFSFRGNNPVREAIHAVFLYHAIAGRPRHGHRQRRRAGRSTTRSSPSCASGSRTSSSTVARTPPSGCSRSPRRYNKAAGEVEEAERGVARAAGRRADHARAGQGHRRPRRGRHRGAARSRSPTAAAARSRSSRAR